MRERWKSECEVTLRGEGTKEHASVATVTPRFYSGKSTVKYGFEMRTSLFSPTGAFRSFENSTLGRRSHLQALVERIAFCQSYGSCSAIPRLYMRRTGVKRDEGRASFLLGGSSPRFSCDGVKRRLRLGCKSALPSRALIYYARRRSSNHRNLVMEEMDKPVGR